MIIYHCWIQINLIITCIWHSYFNLYYKLHNYKQKMVYKIYNLFSVIICEIF